MQKSKRLCTVQYNNNRKNIFFLVLDKRCALGAKEFALSHVEYRPALFFFFNLQRISLECTFYVPVAQKRFLIMDTQ